MPFEPSNDDCDVVGYMTKRGKIVHSWKKRYFVLSGANFLYYADKSRSVLLGGGMCLSAAKWANKELGIVMTSESGRRYQLICDNKRDWNMWLKAFRHAVTLSHKSINSIAIHTRKQKQREKVTMEDFTLLSTVGKGGFGKVLTVQRKPGPHEDAGKVYAMKILKKRHVVKTQQVDSTKAERRILNSMDHPFVVKLRYAFQSSSKLYMVMDYYGGGSLFYHIERLGSFPAGTVRFFAAEITLALDHLHKNGIIYRDLKLENVLLDSDGHVALTDFGLSKDTCDEDEMTNSFCGTPVYVAPEIIQRNRYGTSIDWWALGVVMYEMFTGRVPFASRDRKRMFSKIVHCEPSFNHENFSSDAKSVIALLLTKDPTQRLGCLSAEGAKDVLAHQFFSDNGITDIGQIYRKELLPPFTPSKYEGENNVKGIEARDTNEICDEDICNFENFTMCGEERAPDELGGSKPVSL